MQNIPLAISEDVPSIIPKNSEVVQTVPCEYMPSTPANRCTHRVFICVNAMSVLIREIRVELRQSNLSAALKLFFGRGGSLALCSLKYGSGVGGNASGKQPIADVSEGKS
jgi:hypothetical protein